jgi:ferredoxin
MCNIAAPDLFPLSDDGAVAVTEADIPPGRERDAQTGSTFCPERAITITS